MFRSLLLEPDAAAAAAGTRRPLRRWCYQVGSLPPASSGAPGVETSLRGLGRRIPAKSKMGRTEEKAKSGGSRQHGQGGTQVVTEEGRAQRSDTQNIAQRTAFTSGLFTIAGHLACPPPAGLRGKFSLGSLLHGKEKSDSCLSVCKTARIPGITPNRNLNTRRTMACTDTHTHAPWEYSPTEPATCCF